MRYTLVGAHHPLAYSLTLDLVQQDHHVTLFFQDRPPPPFFSLSHSPLQAYSHLINIFVGHPRSPLSLLPALENSDFIILCLPDPYWDPQSHHLYSPQVQGPQIRESSDFNDLYTQNNTSFFNHGFQETMGHLLRSFSSRSTRSNLTADALFLSEGSSPFAAPASSWTQALYLCLTQLTQAPALFYLSNHQSLWHPQLEALFKGKSTPYAEEFVSVWIDKLSTLDQYHALHQEYIDLTRFYSQLSLLTSVPPRLFFYALPFGPVPSFSTHPPLSAIDLWIKSLLYPSTTKRITLTESFPHLPTLKFPTSPLDGVLSLTEISTLTETCISGFLAFSFKVPSQYQNQIFFFTNQYQIDFDHLYLMIKALKGPSPSDSLIERFTRRLHLFSSHSDPPSTLLAQSSSKQRGWISSWSSSFNKTPLFAWMFPTTPTLHFPFLWSFHMNASHINALIHTSSSPLDEALDRYQAQISL